MKIYKKYTSEENNYLIKLYPKSSKQTLLSLLVDRSWDAIRQQAKKLGIKRIADERKDSKTTKLNKLVNGKPASFYWLGFLLADGNFRGNKAIRCELSQKDSNHLEKLALYINAKVSKPNFRNSVLISVYDVDNVSLIMEILGLNANTNKTHSCPKIEILSKIESKNLLALFAGFIDGDGYIKKNKYNSTYLIISNHISWKPFYVFMIDFFQKYSNKKLPDAIVTKYGYLRWCCGQRNFLINLKTDLDKLNLPLMERKWKEIQALN